MTGRKPVDFKALKAITFAQAIEFLTELPEPKWERAEMRFPCPACGEDDRKRALAVHPTDGFTCYARGKKSGNDAVALVAHVRGITNYEAGQLLEEHFLSKRPTSRAPSAAKVATPEGRTVPNIPEILGIGPAALKALGAEQGDRLVIPLRAATGVQIGTLGIATRVDQEPLLAFTFDDESVSKATMGPDDIKKLFRVVS